MASSRMRPVWVVIPPQSLRQLTLLPSQHHHHMSHVEGTSSKPSLSSGGEDLSKENSSVGRGAEPTSDLQQAADSEEGREKDYVSHSDVEKRRKHKITNCIEQLASLLQLRNGVGKLTRADILEMAVKRIKELVETNSDLEKDVSRLVPDQLENNPEDGGGEAVGVTDPEEVGVAHDEGVRCGREELEKRLQDLVVENLELKQQILDHIASYDRTEGEESGGHVTEKSCDAVSCDDHVEMMTVDQDVSCDPREESCDHQEELCDEIELEPASDHTSTSQQHVTSDSQPVAFQQHVATTSQPATPHPATSQPATSQQHVASMPVTCQQSDVSTSTSQQHATSIPVTCGVSTSQQHATSIPVTCGVSTSQQQIISTSQTLTCRQSAVSASEHTTSEIATSGGSVAMVSQPSCSSALPPHQHHHHQQQHQHQPWPISSLLSAAEQMLEEEDGNVISATPTSRGQSAAAAVRTIQESRSRSGASSTTSMASITSLQVTAPQVTPLQITAPQVTPLQVTAPEVVAVPEMRVSERSGSSEPTSFPPNPIVQPWLGGRSCPQPHPQDHTHMQSPHHHHHHHHHHHSHQCHPYLHRQQCGSPQHHHYHHQQGMYPHSSSSNSRHHVTISHHTNHYSRPHPFHPPPDLLTQHSSLPHPLQQGYGSQESFGMQPYPTGPSSYHTHIPAAPGSRSDVGPGRFPSSGYPSSTAPRGRSYHAPQHPHHHQDYSMLPPPHDHHVVSCDSIPTPPYPPMLGPHTPGQGHTHNTVWRPYSEPHRSTGFYLSDILGDPDGPPLTEHQSLQLEPTPPTTSHRMASFFVDRLLDDTIL